MVSTVPNPQISASVRNFSRRFGQEFGITPPSYIEAVGVEAAKRLLETSEQATD
jgi:transcriptional regulator GlxA family with amidase domain